MNISSHVTQHNEHQMKQAHPTTKRDITIIKISAYIIIFYMISCFPSFLNTFSFADSFMVSYTVFANNCGNSIIYLVADTSFRKEVSQILRKIKCT